MKLIVKLPAKRTLLAVANWVESKNTKGSGLRWLNKFYVYIEKNAKAVHALPLCKYKVFKAKKLICLTYNDWVIACKVEDNNVAVHAVIHRSWLQD